MIDGGETLVDAPAATGSTGTSVPTQETYYDSNGRWIASGAHATLDGEGVRRYGSRWTPRGLPAVFTSATLSLATLERFVNADADL